jgi:zinc and cadmium transporter
MELFYILISCFFISFGALVGFFIMVLKERLVNRILLLFVSLSAGALMGGAFFHLLPEAMESLDSNTVLSMVLFSFIFFFLVEKIFHWRHCHKGECKVHSFGYMNLFGDSIHNFIDGLIIAATFITDIKLGIITTLVVAAHEIPQEIGDYGVLLYAGFDKKKALILNYSVALTVVAGGIVGYLLSFQMQSVTPYLLPFAAGGFLYIAASDLMPELRKETSLKKSMASFGTFLFGVALMFAVKYFGLE